MQNRDFDRKFWSVSWPILLVVIAIAGAVFHLTTDLGFWGSVIPPMVIASVYMIAGTAYLRYRHKKFD